MAQLKDGAQRSRNESRAVDSERLTEEGQTRPKGRASFQGRKGRSSGEG